MDRTPWSYLRLGMINIMIIMAAVIIGTDGQNVQVGEVSLEIGVASNVPCTFDVDPSETVISVYWAASAEEPASFPTDAIIIQYTLAGGVIVPNEEKYGGRVNLTDSFSLVINVVESDFDTSWYACQANVQGVIRFDSKNASMIARGTMSSENTCTESIDSKFECTQGDALTCNVTGFTPNTNFELDWNAAALLIGEQGDLAISGPTEDGYFTASRTLTITEATERISVGCTALGKAYMYAESGQLVGDLVDITVEGDSTGLGGGPIAGIVIGVIVVIGIVILVCYCVCCKKEK